MKKLYLKLICTAALLAALPLAGCSSAGGKQTTQSEAEIITRQADDSCPDNDCKDGDCKDECPEDDKDCKDGCPDCPKKKFPRHGKRGKDVAPKGNYKRRKPPVHPKLPKEPPKDDDIILPDPPVEGEQPKN